MKPIRWYIWIVPRIIKSFILSRHATGNKVFLPIRVESPFLKVNIRKARDAEFVLKGKLRIVPCLGGVDPVTSVLNEKSSLTIDGDLIIGNGTNIFLDKNARLYIGGRGYESAAGITERTRILVRNNVHIGKDCVISWGVFITDCDWHSIIGQKEHSDVCIGDHVWIASNATVLKGSNIGNNCVVAANALVAGGIYADASLIGGMPARVLRQNISWRRDMEEGFG